MTSRSLIVGALAVALGTGVAIPAHADGPPAGTSPARPPAPAATRWATTPLVFTPNLGQFEDEEEHFVAAAGPLDLRLRAGRVDARLGGPGGAAVSLSVRGGRVVRPVGDTRASHVLHLYPSSDPATWREHAPTFARVRYPDVLPRTDMVVHGTGGALEYDFEVRPGGDPSRITVDVRGAQRLRLTRAGDLHLDTPRGVIVQKRPIAYQEVDGRRRDVPVHFVVKDEAVRFAVGAYDRTRTLVIDPEVSFASYFGSASDDFLQALDAANDGSVFVAQRDSNGLQCVTKVTFAPSPSAAFTTCLGTVSPFALTFVRGVEATPDGGVVVVGTTDLPTYPTTPGAYDRTCACEANSFSDMSDAFVTRLDANGQIVASTFLGEEYESEAMREIALDPTTGAIVIAGGTQGRVLPVVGGPSTARVGTLSRSGDATSTWSPRGLSRRLEAIAVSPTNPDELVVIAGTELFRSTDGGATYTRQLRVLTSSSNRFPRLRVLAWSPDGTAVYAGSEDDRGFRRSIDGGRTWVLGTQAVGSRGGVQSIGVSAATPALVLICNEVGLQRSVDHGVTFAVVSATCGPLATTPGPVAYSGGNTPQRSADGGLTWTPISRPENTAIIALAANPANPNEVIAAIDVSAPPGAPPSTQQVVYVRSTDGGQSWVRLIVQTRLGAQREADIVFDPNVPGRARITTTVSGLAYGAFVNNGVVVPGTVPNRRLTFAPSDATVAYRLPALDPADVAVARFSADLSALTYTALISSSDTESLTGLAVNSSGVIYVGSAYGALDGPVTQQLTPTPRSTFAPVLVRLDPSLPGDASLTSMLIQEMSISGLAITDDDVYISGSNRLNGVGVPAAWTAGGVQPAISASLVDALILRLSPDMRTVRGGTYLGGPGADFGGVLEIDAQGSLYLRMLVADGTALSAYAVPTITTMPGTVTQACVRLRPSLDRIEDVVYVGGVSQQSTVAPTGVLYLASTVAATPTLPTSFVRPTLRGVPYGGNDVYLMRVDFTPLAPRLTLLGPGAGSAAGGTVLRVRVDGYTGPLTATIGGTAAVVTRDGSLYRLAVPALPAGTPADVRITYGTDTITFAGAYLPLGDAALGGDADGDGLSDAWEARYSLDPTRNDAALDPDGDGVSNANEFANGTHPTATFARYLAEGAQSDFFSHRLALVNPGPAPVTAIVRAFTAQGTISRREVTVGAERRVTIDAATQPELVGQAFGSEVEAAAPLVVERTMTWDGRGYGSHSETATITASPRWYFAEGATTGAFDLFYLLQNPGTDTATVKASYLLTTGQVFEKTYSVPGRSRFNIWADLEEFSTPAGTQMLLAAAEFSAVFEVTSGPNIIAERAMYLTNAQQYSAGHQSAGVTSPGLRWFLAEGATGSYFDLFVLVGNPGAQAAELTATYLLPDGTTRVKAYTVGPRSRFNIWVDEEQFPEGSGNRALADTAVSVVIESTNGVPVVVERAMWWPGPTFSGWSEAHNSVAMRVTSSRWGVADGEVGSGWATGDCSTGDDCEETYVLVANTGSTAGTVRATLLFEDAPPEVKTFPVAANSRFNISVRDEFPSSIGKRVGMIVEAVGDALPLVVERATYGNAGGQKWAAGANAPGSPLP